MKREVELKLELSPQSADDFDRLSLLPDEVEMAELHAVYFDTPDHQLAERGMSLRIRRSGNRYVQTLKAGGGRGVGLFDRAEWEMPVAGDQPVIDARTPVGTELRDAVGAIAPAFEVDVERRTWRLNEDAAQVELVLDRGEVRAAGRKAPVAEVELELEKGEATELFRIARRIDGEVPVRLGVLSKSERGYQLLGEARSAFKAEPVELQPNDTSLRALEKIVPACLRHYRLNEALLLDHYSSEALHQARVAIRRLRSALWTFKPILAREDVERFKGELKWLAGMLGEARDIDVLAERKSGSLADDRIDAARKQVHATVEKWLLSARVRSLMIDLAEWIMLGTGKVTGKKSAARNQPAAELAAKRLERLFRHVEKGGRKLARLSDEERHAIRKKAKKLRYTSEFLAALFVEKKQRRRHERFTAALEDLQDRLGELNDLVGERALLDHYGLADQVPEQEYPRPKRKRKLLAAATKAHEELMEKKPFWR